MMPSLIFCCEPHSVAAVDTMMDMVVRMVRLIMGVVVTETDEENLIDSWAEPSPPLKFVPSMIELWRETV